MRPEEFIENLERFKTAVTAELPKFQARQAMNTTALVINRIQETGDSANGATLGNYTSEPYMRKREKRGRQTLYVDLTMTRGGAGMFESTGIVAESFEGGICKTKVAGRDEFTQNKLDWNSDRYGDVLEVSAKERALLIENYEQWILDLAIKSGL